MTTTTSQAAASGNQVVTANVASSTRITEIKQSTEEALSSYFPDLNNIGNITTYCMNIWWSENRFNCFGRSGTSRHNTIITGTQPGTLISNNLSDWISGRDFYSGYWADNAIAQDLAKYGQTDAILDGLYAHGVSAVIGAYHVKGCQASNETFGSPTYSSIATNNGLLVEPNTRITDIYTEDQPGRKRSIIAGLIILDYHYKLRLGSAMMVVDRRGNSPYSLLTAIGYPLFTNGLTAPNFLKGTTVTPSQAIILAAGDYLGFGKDANGATGVGRAQFVMSNTSWSYIDANSNSNTTGAGANAAKPIGCTN